VKVIFVGDTEEGEYMRLHLAAYGYEILTRRRLTPEAGLGAAIVPAKAFSGMTPAGVPVVLVGAYDELLELSPRVNVAYLVEAPLRPAEAIRVLNALLGREAVDLRVRAEVNLEAHGLTPAQRAVALHQLNGLRIAGIADTMQVSEKTVKNHLGKIYDLYGVRSSVELRALVLGL
jgi:DNA-binding CsgD family transcriptional regulator